ncbi:MAG: response regulator, partial [Cobetia amphilecti]
GDTPLPHASVLVVEDNEVNQSLARAMLEYLGQQVTVMEDGEQALEWLAQAGNDVDLVFMDMQMPVLDGVETTRRWRQHESEQPAGARLPIIAMTANVMQEDARRCIEAGMQGVLHKPFTRDDLHRVLQQYLVQASDSQASDSQQKALEPDKPEASAGERTTALQVPGDDCISSSAADEKSAQIDAAPAFDVATDDSGARAMPDAVPSLLQHATCQELLTTLSGEAYSRLLSNYLTRLEGRLDVMVTLLKQMDLTELKREAHSLKGASASLGCSGIASGAKALEEAVCSEDMTQVHQHVATLRSLSVPTRDSLLAEGYLFS